MGHSKYIIFSICFSIISCVYIGSFIGRKEGTVNASSSYFILTVGQDGAFEAYPIKNW